MKVAVLGLWHLGTVTAACMAAAGHAVTGWDGSPDTIAALTGGTPPVEEPGLEALVRAGLEAGSLRFTSDISHAVSDAEVVWLAFDTPVDDEDRADVDEVIGQSTKALPYVPDGVVILSSSQLPIGSVARLEHAWQAEARGRRATFACAPENLRLGKAIEVFTKPDRVIVGVRGPDARARLAELFAPITDRIEWMSVESAEMTKHAINAFLATSVTFINELASLCELSGADAKEVERGLKSERRIGPSAYLSPGAAFAGGTLARDVIFLKELGSRLGRPTLLLDGVEASNSAHRNWAQQQLQRELGSLAGKTVALWGLTYKPGTDTLRRSMAVDLCRWLLGEGADVRVHDPAAKRLPDDLRSVVRSKSPLDATAGAAALVVTTEWPEYRAVDAGALSAAMPAGLVLDPNRFLAATLGADSRLRLIAVGQSHGSSR
jgi:UDPglucose 6-dehydrogenase